MVLPLSASSSSSSSSISSLAFSDDGSSPKPSSPSLKFLYSYGGRILPRFPDGRLRYVGGHTRVLSVPRSTSFSDLAARLGELSGFGVGVGVRCQLPTDDLDALVSVTSDEDLASLVEEYDLTETARKIRVFLFPHAPAKAPKSPAMTPCHRRLRFGCGGLLPGTRGRFPGRFPCSRGLYGFQQCALPVRWQ